MFKNYFEQIQNVSIWPIISLIIFLSFFIGLILWLIKVDKGYIQKMKNMPLDDDNDQRDKDKPGPLKLITLLAFLLMPAGSFAQGTASTWNEEAILIWVLILVIIIALLVLMVAIYTLNVLQMAYQKPKPLAKEKKESWWQKAWDRLNKSVPMEKEKDVLLDHNYDGIKELDNHLPSWWTALFYITIIIGVVYMLVYHVFQTAPLPGELYEAEMALARDAAQVRLTAQTAETGSIDENTVTFLDDAAVMENGKKIYDMQCAPCHRNDGGGNIGPNLTDAYWIHGGSINDIFKTVKYGVPQKGMIAWEPLLSPVQMRDVSAYIISLVGTNPAGAKEAQGDLYEEVSGNP